MDILGVVGGGPGYTTVLGGDGRQYTVRGSISYRQNNPGNIRPGEFADRHGAIGQAGGFAVFSSYEAGRAAKQALMFGPSYSSKTIRQAIERYAPATDNNNPRVYSNTIARDLGISPDTLISDLSPEQQTAMLDSMERVEGYRPGPVTNEFGERVDPGIMSAMFDAPTPTEAPRWSSAVPGEVERAELGGVPSGLLGPSVTPAQGYGQLAETMGETPSLNLAGAMPASPMDRMAADPVAQGLDGLRAGLLSQQTGGMYASQQQMADMQDRANLQNDVNEMRGSVTPQSAGLMSFDQATPTQSPAAAAIETAAPQQAAPSLADAYGQLGQSLYQGGVLGLSGQKIYDQNSLAEKLVDPVETASLGTPGYVDPQVSTQGPAAPSVSVQGPASPTVETQQGPTPPADVGSFPAAPTTMGQTAKKVAGRVAGGLLGSAVAGPIGGLLGGLLGNELASGKGLFSGNRQQQSIGGLLSSLGSSINNIGQGAQQSYSVWGGGTPMGTQATATDGSKITQLGGGLLARTDPNGVTTTFNDRGNIVGSPVSTGGLFSGIGRDIADAFGGGGSSGGTGGVDTSGMSPGLW